MTLIEFIKNTHKREQVIRPQIVCKDGFTMSVQGSSGHYCSARFEQDYFFEMEIGFPSLEEEIIMKYAENPDEPTKTVYGYVPCEIIEQVIEKHGGIDVDMTFIK